jgi:diguanylate cyclase (GGDEF)-like protein/PAS domain S-box-containing protein
LPAARDFWLYDHFPSGVFILARDFTIVYWNRCLEQWTGHSAAEMLGTSLFATYPNLQTSRYISRITDIFRGGPPTIFSSQLHRHFIPAPLPGGKFRVLYTVVTGLPSGEENEYLALFSIQDVTALTDAINSYGLAHQKLLVEMAERRKAEAELSIYAEELKRLNQALNERSIRDGLTGAFNHRYFWQVLRRDFLLAQRHENDLSCLLIDLDFFKLINDNFGHLFGDKVLKGVTRRIREKVRKTDIVSRYGGEEFTVLLPNTDLAGAAVIAENIRSGLERSRFRKGQEIVRITVSVGIVSLAEHGPASPQQLLDFADAALYKCKDAGRNRVLAYSP